ncbi:head maturation protease, ClpP-related [Chengkuizengella marina]|uniref:head maturation protease, ClpP-related n=1 Tax=Chengkuizengella marina TaxID=2507566 RepID=UPI002E28459A|nr:head maturation protease, ClpP-related [Chengkuizengella marina]
MEKFWKVKAIDYNTGEMQIYGEISSYQDDTDTTAQSFKEDLDRLGGIKTLNLYMNSPGGSVYQGNAIYNILKRHKAKINVHIDGIAASISSVIAMAGDTIFMPVNAMMMVHNPWTFIMGNADQLSKEAEALDKTRESMIVSYLSKTGKKLDRDTLISMLDNETWLSAKECYDYGLCDVVEEEKTLVASVNTEFFAKYKNTPKKLLEIANQSYQMGISEEEKQVREQIKKESEVSIQKLNLILGGI